LARALAQKVHGINTGIRLVRTFPFHPAFPLHLAFPLHPALSDSALPPGMEQAATGPLLPNGFLPVGLVLPDTVIPALLNEAKARTYAGVFNRVGGGDDKFRQQSRVNPRRMSASMVELKRALEVVIEMIHPGWTPGVFSFMRSKPGGIEQEPHQDYQDSDLATARRHRPDGVPGSMIFALEPGTVIRVYTGCFATRDDSRARIVNVPVGFCVLFRGDLVHNGMPYAMVNHRIHCYLSYEGVRWTPDLVQNVLPEHGECEYCGVKMLKGPRFRKHKFYCDGNPDVEAHRLKRKREGKNGVFVCEVCRKTYTNQGSLRVHNMRGH
jgi:hypothetical protein